MKQNKAQTTIKAAFLSLVLALVILFAGIPTGGALQTQAKTNSDSWCYYITDNPNYQDMFDNAIAPGMSDEEGYHSEYCIIYNWAPDDYWDQTTSRFWHNVFDNAEQIWDISDAYIIFEVSVPLTSISFNNENIFSKLEQIFRTWNQNGCHIMFICGTDEVRFNGELTDIMNVDGTVSFLQYVDIHINTDLYTPFGIASMNKMLDLSAQDSVFVVGKNLVPRFGQPQENSFVNKFMENYFSYNYPNDTVADWLFNHNSSLIIETWDGYYEDYVTKRTFSCSNGAEFAEMTKQNESDDYIRPIYWFDQTASSAPNWEFWHEMSGLTNVEISMLINSYPLKGYQDYVDMHGEGCYGVHTFGMSYQMRKLKIAEIVATWLMDVSQLSNYDNWVGACDVTYKPLLFGSDDWFTIPSYNSDWQYLYLPDY